MIVCKILDINIVGIAGSDTVISSILNSFEVCYKKIPDFKVEKESDFHNVPFLLMVREAKKACIIRNTDNNIEIEGNISLLSALVWYDIILGISAAVLRRKSLFYLNSAGIVCGNEIYAFCGWSDSGLGNIALALHQNGRNVCFTESCIIDSQLNVISGSNYFYLRIYLQKKQKQDYTDNNKLQEAPYNDFKLYKDEHLKPGFFSSSQKSLKISRIYHIYVVDSSFSCKEVCDTKNKAVLSIQSISRLSYRYIIIAPWNVVLPINGSNPDYWKTNQTIRRLSDLKHFTLFASLNNINRIFLNK